ncbi:MAG TPA: aromatic ring-hydroxylating dioxygenase subunit alpha [Stellaceae bacterium]|nr:aromatic ring-hydroxylating dioxygenase subunit alpha [Stellaceae bacterium]
MSEASLTALLGPDAARRVREPIKTARPLAGAAYTSEAYHRLEMERVLGRSWTGVGFAHQVPNPGDAIPVTAAGLPAIVLRDRAGEIRVFHNVCRHRGSVILSEPVSGQPTLRCPYHGWAYGLDGSLKATPLWDGKRVADAKSIDRASRGLVPIRSGVWMDVVFVNVSGDAPPLESVVAPLDALSAPYDMGRFRLAHYQAGDVPANWKLTVEAAVENYHEEFVHQQLPARVDPTTGARTYEDVFEGEVFGFSWAGDSALRSDTPLVPSRSKAGNAARTDHLCFLFPNTQISLFGSLALRTLWVPTGVETTRWHSSWYLVDDSATDDEHRGARDEMIRYWLQLRGEDRAVLSLMQQGRHSPVADDLRLSPFWEGSILHFHRKIVDALTAAAS